MERRETQFIFGCDYCEENVASSHPRQRIVEGADPTNVSTIRKPATRDKDTIRLPVEQEYELDRSHNRNKISVITPTVLQLEAKNWVTVSAQRHGLIKIEPLYGFYHK